jgi:hypothetical protein
MLDAPNFRDVFEWADMITAVKTTEIFNFKYMKKPTGNLKTELKLT